MIKSYNWIVIDDLHNVNDLLHYVQGGLHNKYAFSNPKKKAAHMPLLQLNMRFFNTSKNSSSVSGNCSGMLCV